MIKTSKTILIKRLAIYVLGIFCMALGVSFSVKSDLGVTPLNSIARVLSLACPDISMGMWSFIIFCCYLLIQIMILRREFRPSQLLQIVCSSLFGLFVDLCNWLAALVLPVPPNYIVRLVYLVVSMMLVALGILLYLAPDILPMPSEGVMQAIQKKTGLPFYICKISFDVTAVIVAVVISLLNFGYLSGVREGTILASIGVGKFLGFFTTLLQDRIKRFLALNPASNEPDALPDIQDASA